MIKSRSLVVCGPTATGKTSLALKLSKELRGEIISADSRQVYRGMDIGTGKDLPTGAKEKAKSEKRQLKTQKFKDIRPYRFGGISVWLLDIVDPDYRFSVADYLDCARVVVDDLDRRDKLPIFVGGTGLYLRALFDGLDSGKIGPDWNLRKRMEALPVGVLQQKFKKLAPQRFQGLNESDRQNPRRLIRGIEVAQCSKDQQQKKIAPVLTMKPVIVALKAPDQSLTQRIGRRVEERVKKGIEKEITSLLTAGYHWQNSVLGTTLGYRQWQSLYEKKDLAPNKKILLRKNIIEQWKTDEVRYARRQMTWFKKQKSINWFDISEKKWLEDVESFLKKCYHKNHAEEG